MLVSVAVISLWQRWIIVASVISGFSWTALAASLFLTPLAPGLEGRDLVVEGEIEGLPVRFKQGWRFNFLLHQTHDKRRLPSKLRLSWYNSQVKLAAGETWRFQVRLKRPHGLRNPGGFDYEKWLYAHRIGAMGYVRDSNVNQRLYRGGILDSLRQHLANQLRVLLQESPVQGVIEALVIGDRSGISQTQWQVLRTTGTAHLVAISGLHISLIAGMAYGISRRIWLWWGNLRLPADWFAAVIAMIVAMFYAALAGFSIPTQRALIMVVVALGALVQRRALHPFHSLLLALLAVCIHDPWAPLSAGFWLSFTAVFLILYGLTGRLRRLNPVMGFIRVQWILWLGLAPLLLIFSGQISWIAPIANSIAVPVMAAVVLPLSLLGSAAVLWFPMLGQKCLQGAEWLLSKLWQWLEWLSGHSQFAWPGPVPESGLLFFAILSMVLLLAPRGMPGRWLAGIMILPLLLNSSQRFSPGEARLTVLDVGQGLAALIQTRNHVLLYDAGPRFSERFDAGRDIIIPYLRRQGRSKVDLVVISHSDSDHRGGLSAIVDNFPSAEVFTNDPQALGVKATPCRRGQQWYWDGVRFEILWPQGSPELSENNRSCVLKVTAAQASLLLPGDLEAPGEQALLAKARDQLTAMILLSPHHGSATSSTQEFLKAVRPQWVLISSGYRNRFGFPDAQVIERYRKIGARVCNTAVSGAITVQLKAGGKMKVFQAREHDGPFWRIHRPETCS